VRRGTIGRCGRRSFAVQHPVIPCLVAVGRTPDVTTFDDRIRRQNVVEKSVDGDVVDPLQRLIEMFAIAAVRIFEYCDHTFAIALDVFHRKIQRQIAERNLVDFFQPRFGQILQGFTVDDTTDKQILRLDIGINDIAVDLHFIQTGIRRLGDRLHFCIRAETWLDRLADCCFLRGFCEGCRQDQAC
jgi:hypothetical protein